MMELDFGKMCREGFIDRSLAALTIGEGLPLWYAREVLAAQQERESTVRRASRHSTNDQIVMGGIGVGGQGTGEHEMGQAQAGSQVSHGLRCRRGTPRKSVMR